MLVSNIKTSLEILEHILVVVKTGWTKEAGAGNALGGVTDPLDPQACCWCMLGALYRASEVLGYVLMFKKSELLTNWELIEDCLSLNWSDIISFNGRETTTQADVVKLLESGITKLRNQLNALRTADNNR